MRALLATFSFLAILLLTLIIPGQVKSNTIPAVSIICWLFACNIIHAANSIVWANNVDIHAPVWCDISTKVLLGAMVAIPGALFCISRQLEILTSRYTHTKMPTRHHKLIVESIMCIVIPLLYMSLHTIVQFRRFSILGDFGCQPAVHDSLPGLILVWLPPFVISSIAFFYNCSAAINLGKSHYNSVEYFPSVPQMQLSLFLRRLTFATAAVLYAAVAYAIVLSWSSAHQVPWTSISRVHANFSQPEIVQPGTQLEARSELIWWSIPVWSFLLCALSAFGEETKKGYRKIWAWITGRAKSSPFQTKTRRPRVDIPNTPVSHIHLRSPWEATVRSDTTIKLKGSSSIASLSPTSLSEDENTFTQSTLHYLESDAARQLQLPSPPPMTVSRYRTQTFAPPTTPPPQLSTSRTSLAQPSPPRTPPIELEPVQNQTAMPIAESIPRSRTSSILSASAWPQPPPSPPSMHPYALCVPQRQPQPQPQPRTLSPAPSFSSDIPFQGVSIIDAPAPAPQSQPRRVGSTRSGKGKIRAPNPIQLTVMRETLVDT